MPTTASRWPRPPTAPSLPSATTCSASANWQCSRPTRPTPRRTAPRCSSKSRSSRLKSTRVATQTQFNGTNLLDGSFTSKVFQVGANAGQTITVGSIASARSSALGQFQGYTLTNQSIGTASNTPGAATVTIGGVSTSLGSIANDAKAIVGAINSSGLAGFTASANATSVAAGTQALTATVAGTSVVTVNGLAINVGVTVGNATTNRANTVAALNAQSSATGVVATDTGSGVSLAAADGRKHHGGFRCRRRHRRDHRRPRPWHLPPRPARP